MTDVPAVIAGDVDGRGSVYARDGRLLVLPDEAIVTVASGWDMHVWSPWGGLHPEAIFVGFNTKVTSTLYVTSNRVVLVRDVDPGREVAGEMTPLGIPTAVAKEVRLKRLKTAGVRQYCQVRPALLTVVKSAKSTRKGSRLALRLEDGARVRYAVTYWKTDGKDDETLNILESRFRR